jgi:hypothetical protein
MIWGLEIYVGNILVYVWDIKGGAYMGNLGDI